MPTDAELIAARVEVLEACRERHAESPAGWIGGEREDVEDLDAIESAARELASEGLIQAVFAEDRTSVEARITPAGLSFLRAGAGRPP